MPRLSKIGAAALAAFGWTGLNTVSASYLVVAGGGSGGVYYGGGGGAGGLLTGTTALNPTESYTVVVGAGAAAAVVTASGLAGNNGSNSQFGILTAAVGGGAGGYVNVDAATTGGSGGGAGGSSSTVFTAKAGTSGQGNAGGTNGTISSPYPTGGGGGAGAVGANGSGSQSGAGGAGTASSISGTSVTYAGGGGGGGTPPGSAAGAGGSGGGGAGSTGSANATAGTANTGGGGGGASSNAIGTASGQGGSGVVIISYPSPQKFGGGIVTVSGSNTIHTFTTSGTLSPLSTLSTSYLIVAGGGGAGTGNVSGLQGGAGGGGGAGGMLTGSGTTIDTNSIYIVTVGAGGAAGTLSTSNGSNGANSAFSAYATISVGGGGGGIRNSSTGQAGSSGGSGGGGGFRQNAAGGAGTSGQGNAGGNSQSTNSSGVAGGGGGGGASATGQSSPSDNVGGNGGAGLASSISGSSVTYAGGGGGGSYGGAAGTGGAGGGGNGNNSFGGTGTAGTANLGGGGGGGGDQGAGGSGGSGIVIISYAGSVQQMAGGTVTISGGNVIHTFTSSGYLTPLKYVGNSLRFRSSASAYLNRTPTTAGNRKTWTWSGWVKRGTLGSTYYPALFMGGTTLSDAGLTGISFIGDTITLGGYNTYWRISSAVYRDPAAWYHVVVALDTTQAVAANRALIYVNGVQVTAFSTNNTITQNTDFGINQAALHTIGYQSAAFGSSYYDGYMTEINFIDGQALTPNSFGTFNQFGVWQPIVYGGSYGTNGFYLKFNNATSTTTLGLDSSPQGNNWTTNNISVTAGVTYDSMTDVPTLTSTTAANYCVLNAISIGADATLSAGNLQIAYGSSGTRNATMGTFGMSAGKWYWECTILSAGSPSIGITNTASANEVPNYPGFSANGWSYVNDGDKYNNGSGTAYGATYTTNDIIGVAFDADARSITFYKNNVSQGVAFSGLAVNTYFPAFGDGSALQTWSGAVNFGQRPFAYTAPSGFLPLNTFNL